MTLLGYNVYRDDKLIAEKLSTTSFTDNEASIGSHTYYVTAVWKEGESNCSGLYQADITTGISTASSTVGISVATSKNLITVSGAEGKNIEVVNLAGQTIFRGVAAGATSVSVATGVYLVKVANKAVKVIVK